MTQITLKQLTAALREQASETDQSEHLLIDTLNGLADKLEQNIEPESDEDGVHKRGYLPSKE